METDMPHNEKLFAYLFSFGDKVEIITPLDIREEMQSRLKKIQRKYKT